MGWLPEKEFNYQVKCLRCGSPIPGEYDLIKIVKQSGDYVYVNVFCSKECAEFHDTDKTRQLMQEKSEKQ